ncbi:hypothetical protein HD554DRAFT_2040304 [Boletus coccyginus]|nr:hypothetical protein HD554DRAFT_2040303 [Boletus coccyginus]KAI9566284.1 hypothetical protein HD554DRAFT_2040304 [Boletus coccyginus]
MIDIFSFWPVCIIRFAHFKDPPKCAKQHVLDPLKCAKQHVLVHSHYHPSHPSFRAFQGPPEMRETTCPGPPEMREITCPALVIFTESFIFSMNVFQQALIHRHPGHVLAMGNQPNVTYIFHTTATMYYATHAS